MMKMMNASSDEETHHDATGGLAKRQIEKFDQVYP
jgi:hypothetical protein